MAIGNKHNSAETRDSQAKYWGGGAFTTFSPNQIIRGHVSRGFGAYGVIALLKYIIIILHNRYGKK